MKKRLFTLLLALCMVFSMLPLTVSAAELVASGECGRYLTWKLTEDGVLTISGSGAMDDFTEGRTPWRSAGVGVKSVVIENGVTTIGKTAFESSGVLSVTLPNSLTSIGSSAFYGCSKLASINIPDSVTSIGFLAFYRCHSLTSITLPKKLTSIETSTFSGCSGLTSVTLPDSVTDIGETAFEDCSSLTGLTLPKKLASIGERAFAGCSSLTSITIPESVTSIGIGAFSACSSLNGIWVDEGNPNYSSNEDGVLFNKAQSELLFVPGRFQGEYSIPESVTSIGSFAFNCCKDLTAITIPNSVTSIGEWAFSYCDGLTNITIPESVTSIGGNGFFNCGNLTEISFTGNAPSIGEDAFFNVRVTAYYPSLDETWTSNVMQNYGGIITWKAYCPDGHVSVIRNAAEATCTEDGYTGDKVCENCGELISKGSVVPATGHSFGEWTVTTEPTCTEKGTETRTCSVCEATETQEIEATGHSVSDWVSVKEPTCTEKGEETGTCATCGETVPRDVDALGHTMGEDCVDNEDGKTHTGTCTVCGELVEDDPHNFVDGFCEDCGAMALVAPELLSIYSREQTSCKATWTLVDHAEGYELWRTTDLEDEDSWTRTKTIKDGTQDRYTNQGLEIGTTYYYKVRAYIGEEEASRVYSDFSEVKYMPAAVVFDGPYSNATFRIRLRWNEIGGADGYQIWRLDDTGTWKIVKTLGDKGNTLTNDQGATTAYSNTGLEAGKQYTYKMRAFSIPEDGVKVYGAYSDAYTVAVKPEAPELTATSPKAGRAEVTWEAVNGAAGYQIWMSESENGAYKIVKSITDGSTTYTKYDLTSGKTYYFKVRAYTEVNGKKTFGDYSQVSAVTVK